MEIRGGGITEMENSYYGFLLRFITVYYGVFIADITGLFLRISLNLNQNPQKAPETLKFEKNPRKIERYYGILRIFRKSL